MELVLFWERKISKYSIPQIKFSAKLRQYFSANINSENKFSAI
jgi:hypothetical protein